jgi:hypothetical protein
MSRVIVFLAVLALLSLRFIDAAAHQHAHGADGAPAGVLTQIEDKGESCGSDALHAAAHCASHMAEAMQRSSAATIERPAPVRGRFAVARDLGHDGRGTSPPVRPPLA